MTDKVAPLVWFIALLLLLVLGIPPRNPPGAAPVRAFDVAPVHYAAPAPLSFQPGDYEPPPYPEVTYEDRFSPDALGDWAWSDAIMGGHCPISRAVVTAQGVGE